MGIFSSEIVYRAEPSLVDFSAIIIALHTYISLVYCCFSYTSAYPFAVVYCSYIVELEKRLYRQYICHSLEGVTFDHWYC